MKSALEKAMERFGGHQEQSFSLTEEQKEQLAEVDRKYEGKIAHARLTAEEKSRYLQNPAEIEQLKQDVALEVKTYEERRDREKEALREKFANNR